jgi:hypothetical protein
LELSDIICTIKEDIISDFLIICLVRDLSDIHYSSLNIIYFYESSRLRLTFNFFKALMFSLSACAEILTHASFVGAVLLICVVRSFINGFDLTIINNFVLQNSCLDFPTIIVISLSRCNFRAEISTQKISLQNTTALSSNKNVIDHLYWTARFLPIRFSTEIR